MAMEIPDELVDMLRERRVIPFIGAGFSAAVGLPDWDAMLRAVAPEIQGVLDYDRIRKCCNGDHLQIAEYYFLKLDRSVGPLRHQLATLLRPRPDCPISTPHVELVNLNAQQVYTTNFDEVIESTFRQLGHQYAFVALPKHIATADRGKPQVVKYHGDLRYDTTLVLTESSYYSRLEFESPMDLKFRSDLLGQSVLFIGYSFRDINIRIIWFKLMEMMKDVPELDRRSSFIVRLERNEVLEELYRAVGIKTIHLDPESKATTSEEKTRLLGRFMLELSMRAAHGFKMPGSDHDMYLSPGLMAEIREAASKNVRNFLISPSKDVTGNLIKHASGRVIPTCLETEADQCLYLLARTPYGVNAASWAAKMLCSGKGMNGAAFCIMRALTREAGRRVILGIMEFPWERLWSAKIAQADAELLIKALRSEVEGHASGEYPDDDIAYVADLVKRIEMAMLVEPGSSELKAQASDALTAAAKLVPAIRSLSPAKNSPPDVEQVVAELAAARGANPPADDDIPF